jgi:hypothetical protein
MEKIMPIRLPIAMFLVILCFGALASAEMVTNPIYASWAGCKPGTVITLKLVTTSDGQTVNIQTKSTLVEITDEKLVTEDVVTIDVNGQKVPAGPAKKSEIPKMAERDSQKAGQVDAAKLATAKEETITVPAGTFKAKLIPVDGEQQGMKVKGKAWFSETTPGGTIKLDMHAEGAKTGDIKMELLSVEKK